MHPFWGDAVCVLGVQRGWGRREALVQKQLRSWEGGGWWGLPTWGPQSRGWRAVPSTGNGVQSRGSSTPDRHSWGTVSKVLCRWLLSPGLFFQPVERLPQSRPGLLQRKDSAKVKVPTVILIFTSHCCVPLLTELRVELRGNRCSVLGSLP